MPLARPRGIIFDFGDTLLREGPIDLGAGASRVLQLARDTGGCTVERLAEAMSALIADLRPRRQVSEIEAPPDTFWRLIYDPMGIRFDLDPSDVEWAFFSAASAWTPEPGVYEVLRRLAESQLPCGVLSNTMYRSRTIARQLEASDLGGTFQWVMTSADFVLRKPHRRLFELAAQRIGAEPAAIWHVGDSYESDVCGAAEAGMVPIWYRIGVGEGRTDPAARVVGHWREFNELLASALDVA